MFELDYWIEGIITKTWALVSLDGQTSKKLWSFEKQGLNGK